MVLSFSRKQHMCGERHVGALHVLMGYAVAVPVIFMLQFFAIQEKGGESVPAQSFRKPRTLSLSDRERENKLQ
ncbi:hypothetical protein D3C75_255050 [compost metagenome]